MDSIVAYLTFMVLHFKLMQPNNNLHFVLDDEYNPIWNPPLRQNMNR